MLVSGQFQPDKSFKLLFNGPSNQTYRVLSSTNVAFSMTSWVALSTNTFNGVQTNYVDTAATNYRTRAYRLQSPFP